MKKRLITLILFIPVLFFSCLEEIDYEQDQYVKALGLEGSAIAERVIELDNGDIMVLGKLGRAAHDIFSGYIGIEIESLEDQAPFIAILDPNGNIKQMKSYPINSLDLTYAILYNFANKTSFEQVLEDPNGGYTVLAASRGFDVQFVNTPFDVLIEDTPDNRTVTPLLLKLDEDLNLTRVLSFNCQENWDFVYRTRAVMKPLPNNEIGILIGLKLVNLSWFSGYTFIRMNHNFDTLGFGNDFDRDGIKLGYNFTYDQENRITVIGERDDQLALFRFPLDNMVRNEEEFQAINHAGEVPNFNEHFILEQRDGNYAVLFFNPASNVIFQRRDKALNQVGSAVYMDNPSPITSLIRVPRAFYQTQNGDFLVYNQHIPDSQEPVEGYLHRISATGEHLWATKIEGTPGDVTETADGSILVVANTVYNGLLHRINLIKLNAHGELY